MDGGIGGPAELFCGLLEWPEEGDEQLKHIFGYFGYPLHFPSGYYQTRTAQSQPCLALCSIQSHILALENDSDEAVNLSVSKTLLDSCTGAT